MKDSHSANRETTEIQSALAALLAAKASSNAIAEAATSPTVVILPSGTKLPPLEAARVLAGIGKPAWCISSVNRGQLGIECRELSPGAAKEAAVQRTRTAQFVLDWVGGHVGSVRSEELVRLEGPADHRVIRFESLLRWVADYDGDWAFGLTDEHPSIQAGEVRFVVSVAPSDAHTTIASNRAIGTPISVSDGLPMQLTMHGIEQGPSSEPFANRAAKAEGAVTRLLAEFLAEEARQESTALGTDPVRRAGRLAHVLVQAGVLNESRLVLLVLALRDAGWPSEQQAGWRRDLASEMLGVILSGEDHHVAEFLRVWEARIQGDGLSSKVDYLALARRLRASIT